MFISGFKTCMLLMNINIWNWLNKKKKNSCHFLCVILGVCFGRLKRKKCITRLNNVEMKAEISVEAKP